MKKPFLLLAVLLTALVCAAQEEEKDNSAAAALYATAFEQDHSEFRESFDKAMQWKRKIKKRALGYYEEKNQFTPSKEDTANGFSFFVKSCAEDVFPNTRPKKEELVTDLNCFGVPGEYVPVVLCVLPLEDLKGMTVSVTDLKNGDSRIISGNIEVTAARYECVPIGRSSTGVWYVKNRYLVKGPANGYSGIPRPFWITVKIPENALPGIYKGEASINAGKKSVKLPYTLEVFPFKFIPWGKDHTFWMWYYKGYPADNSMLEAHLSNLSEHGMNCFDSFLTPFKPKVSGDSVSLDFYYADNLVVLLKKYGFTKWMFDNRMQYDLFAQMKNTRPWSDEHRRVVRDFAEKVAFKAKKPGWPTLVFTFDEPREEQEKWGLRGYLDIKNTFEIFKSAGLLVNASWSSWGGQKRKDDSSKIADYSELCPIPYYNTTHGNYKPSDKIIDKVLSLKKPLLLYNCGAYRYCFGYLTYQRNALGNSQFWWGAAVIGDPTSEYAHSSCAVTSRDGKTIYNTTSWEQIREGVYDYRYMITLDDALLKCKNKNSPEAVKALALLEEIKNYKIESSMGTGIDADFLAEQMRDFTGGAKMDEFKYRIAKSIMELQAAK